MDPVEVAENFETIPVEAVGFLVHRSKTKVILSQHRGWDEELGWGYRDHLVIPAKNVIRLRKMR